MPATRLAFLLACVIAAAGVTVYATLILVSGHESAAKIVGILSILAMGTAVALRKANDK